MPPGRKERDVLARQKELAAIMAAKRRPAAGAKGNSATAGSSTGLAAKRPRVRGRSSGNPSTSSPIIDLTGSNRDGGNKGNKDSNHNTRDRGTDKAGPPGSGTTAASKKVVMGIHKSFKRRSVSSVMAEARAKAKQQRMGKLGEDGGGSESGSGGNESTAGASSSSSSSPPNKPPAAPQATTGNAEGDEEPKKPARKRLASLVHNAASSSSASREDWSAGLATSNITPDDFWKNIRKWDFVGQLARMQLDGGRSHGSGGDEPGRQEGVVPDTFVNARHYVSVWAPLCLAECRAQILSDIVTECGQSRGGRNASPLVLVAVEPATARAGRHVQGPDFSGGVGDSCQLVLRVPRDQGRGGPQGRHHFFPHDICCLVPVEKKDLVENLLFRGSGGGRQGGGPKLAAEDPESEVFRHACIVGHTEAHRNDLHGLVLRVSKRKWARVGSSGGKAGSGGSQMYFFKIGCNITALREFTALSSVDTIPLKSYLFGTDLRAAGKQNGDEAKPSERKKARTGGNGRPDPRRSNKDSLLRRMGGVEALGKGFTEYARRKFNPSQLTAISASSQGYGDGGFTLIKGPPGTGKTTTLVNILNALHIRQFNKYYEEVRKIVALQSGNRQAALEIARRAKPRLLVCAPSNAAVDNVILKIMEDGFIDGRGQRYNPSITRIGVGQSAAVKDVALETKVDQILSETSDLLQLENSIAGFRMELQRITTDIMKCRKRIHAITNASPWPLGKDWEIRVDEESFDETGRVFFVNHKDHTTTYECPPPPEPGEKQFHPRNMPEYHAFMGRTVKLVESYFRIKTNLEQATITKGSIGAGARHFEVKQNLEMHVLNSVHIVMTTLGTAGNRALEGVDKFEVVVVDEAAQSVEPATLAAMQLGSRHCVMVGDPQQLPATIFNVSGKNSKYDRSLFQRLEEAGEKVYMLDEQYRMHPQISHFPRHIFYKGALKDGPNVSKAGYGNPLVEAITSRLPAFRPFTVLDLDSKEERGGTSLSNSTEADLAVYLYKSLKQITDGASAASRVAVITPYSQQAGLLRRKFGDLLGKNYAQFVEVNTVDAFQGREAKIVVFSAVRAAGSRGIGFLSDVRRMNVALTRAKHFLFVIARCKSIVVNPYWKDLVEHARDTNAVVSVPILRKGKKGKTNFAPVKEWRLVGTPPAPPPPPPPPQAPAPRPRAPPAEGSSFRDQLAFFQNNPNSLVAQASQASAPLPNPQAQTQAYPPNNNLPPQPPPALPPQYPSMGGPNIAAPPPPPPQPAPMGFPPLGVSAPPPPPPPPAPTVFVPQGAPAPQAMTHPAPLPFAPQAAPAPPLPQYPAPAGFAPPLAPAPPPPPPPPVPQPLQYPAPVAFAPQGAPVPPLPPLPPPQQQQQQQLPAPVAFVPQGAPVPPLPPPQQQQQQQHPAPIAFVPQGVPAPPLPPPQQQQHLIPVAFVPQGVPAMPPPQYPNPAAVAPQGALPGPPQHPAPGAFAPQGIISTQPPPAPPTGFAPAPPPLPPPQPNIADPRIGAPVQGNDPRRNYGCNMDPRRQR
ncbi:unnamed protein product [Pseudo-nitzschia multistriata]|uniref:WW domain-containing protein n=1 Tax=Pseudo-nitzschia multistriata TaxID=183589 RepID=A0A448Z5I0_9STRA|nr:unnamed protein product [Pseudo-nitzschia multistriata]